MPSQGGGVAYNDQWISGWVQAGGWTDQQPRMFQLAHGYFDTLERSILGVYVGNSVAYTQVVVYLRGGGTYYIRTDSSSVIAYSTAYSVTEVGNTNTFAIKDVNGADVVGTSTGISQLFFGVTSSNGTYTSGVNVVQNVNSTYTTPATTGSYASDAAVINRISGGDIVLDTGMTSSGPVWLQARRFSNFADKFALLLNPNGGNVGIGTMSPSVKLDIVGSLKTSTNSTNYVVGTGTAVTVNTTTPTTVASVTITTVGKPVFIVCCGDLQPVSGTPTADWCYVRLYQGASTTLGNQTLYHPGTAGSTNHMFSIHAIDVPAAGTYTYTCKAWQGSGSIQFGEVGVPYIVAWEFI
jgi:hypothetical protein